MRSALILVIALLALATGPVYAQYNTGQDIKAITGYWLTDDGEGAVELYPCRDKICGRFHWLKDDSLESPSLDDRNRDPALQSRPLCGMQFMGGFEPRGEGYFSGGWIYSVRDGNTYSASLMLTGADTLELRGYFLIPLFGQSRTWTRTGPEPVCQTLKSIRDNNLQENAATAP